MSKRPTFSQTEDDILKEQDNFIQNKEKCSVKLIKTNDIIPKITNAEIKTKETQPMLLVGEIVERKSSNSIPISVLKPSTGFPLAKRRENAQIGTKKSIFAQKQMKLSKTSDVHKENMDILSKMSEEEILEEQNKLLKTLDPKLISFLKSKQKKTIEKMETKASVEPIIPSIPENLLENSENWLNFDRIEVEKMEWMRDIDIPKQNTNETYEARFDFAGWLLPYSQPEINERNRILFHHGDESHRPGYTLKELFTLSRSNVQQQRILALNTISRILYLNSTGIYDKIIEIPFEQIFFVIRFSVDDNSPNILFPSLKCLQNLLVSDVDESCLDVLQGFGCEFEPILGVDTKIDKDMNDQQVAEIDLIRCLIRTDIFTRFRYIINTIKPHNEVINCCLNIIIRIIRDSNQILTEFYNFENLISNIIKKFVILDNNRLPLAIKLLKTIACRNKKIAEDLINRYNIFDAILSYFNTEITTNILGIKLQIEIFKLIKILFKYGLKIDCFCLIEPSLMFYLNYHLQNTNYDTKSSLQMHFSGIINIVFEVFKHNSNLISNFQPILMQMFNKFCFQVSNLTKFNCLQLQAISTMFNCLTPNENIDKTVLNLLLSDGFKIITTDIKNGSNLICELESHKTGSNLMSLESAVWENSEHVVSCFKTNSCVPFLSNLSNFIVKSSKKIITTFLQHTNIQIYLNILNSKSKYNFTSNWFTKLESNLILNILKCSFKVENTFLFYQLAVKTLSIYSEEQKTDIDFILKNIIFNKNYFPNEMLMSELKIDQNTEILNILPNLNEIYGCYSNVLGLNKTTAHKTMEVKIGTIIPIDWVFMPIMVLYSQNDENSIKTIDEQHQMFIITRCLQWIYLYESYFPNLSSFVNATDKFCRLSCIYLCSNSLFLENNIQHLLKLCFKILIKPENLIKINFDNEIQGLNNFQDFYTQLLEQYQGVSYGDKLFANFVLLPLTQKNNPKWKKIFWSEYSGVAQTIILDLNESLIDLNQFLDPLETDISILKSYRRALLSKQLNRSNLLKYIAQYHVDKYLNSNVLPPCVK